MGGLLATTQRCNTIWTEKARVSSRCALTEVMAIDVPFAQLPEEHPLHLDAAAIGGGGDGQIAMGTVRLKYVDDGIQETIEWKDRPIVQDTDIKEGPYVDADRANEDWNEVKDYILRVRRNYRKSSDLVQYLLTNDTFRQRFLDAHRIFAFGASIPAVSIARPLVGKS